LGAEKTNGTVKKNFVFWWRRNGVEALGR